jgi:hypothetical protein
LSTASAVTWDVEEKSFDFTVVAPHLDQSGLPNKGYYVLSLPISQAKCRWGEIQKSARASVEILDSSGQSKIFITSLQVKENTRNFVTSGFNFSSPTIKTRLVSNIDIPKLFITTSLKE